MKTKLLSLILIISCLFSLTACGSNAQSTAEVASEPAQVPQAFGTSTLEDVPVQEAQTTTLPEAAETSEAPVNVPSAPDADASSAVQDFTEQAVTAAIICDAMDALPYTPEDPMYIWRAVGYLIGQIGTDADLITMEGDFGHIASESALIFAHAIDADYSGDVPSVTEEDPLISIAEDGGYLINMLSQGDLVLEMTRNRDTAEGDTCTEEAELFQNGESLGVYTVTLSAYTGGNDGGRYFAYSIQDISSK